MDKHQQKGIDDSYFKIFIEELEDGIIFEDSRGFIIYANKKVAEMLQYSKEELIGKHWSEIVPHDVIEKVSLESSERKYGKKSSYETEILSKSGDIIPVIVSSNPLFLKDGRFNGVLTVFTDISDLRNYQNRLKEERDKSRKLLDIVAVTIIVLDIKGKITLINKMGCQILACSEDQAIGKDFFETFMDEKDREYSIKIFNKIIKGEKLEKKSYQSRVKTLKGEKRIIVWNYILLKDNLGRTNGLLISGADITEAKKTRFALKERVKELQCLYSINKLLSSKHHDTDSIFDEIVNIIPKGFQKPEKTCVSIEINKGLYKSKGFLTTECMIKTDILLNFKKVGELSVYYLGKDCDPEKVFLKEEKNLIEALAKEISLFLEKKDYNTKIKESIERYRLLFEHSPVSLWEQDLSQLNSYLNNLKKSGVELTDSYFLKNPEKIIRCLELIKTIDVNIATCRIFEANVKNDLLKSLKQLVTEESYPALAKIFSTINTNKNLNKIEVVCQTLKGRKINVLFGFTVVPSHKSTLSRVLISIEDITERKKSEEKFRVTFKESPIGKILLDPETFSVEFNEALIKTLGIKDLDPVIDLGNFPLLPEITNDERKTLAQGNVVHKTFKIDYDVLSKSEFVFNLTKKGIHHFDLLITPISIDKSRSSFSLLIHLRDITQEVQAKEFLEQARDLLRQTVKRRTRALEEEQKRIVTVIETLPDGIAVIEPDGTLYLANKGFKKFYSDIYNEEMPNSIDKFPLKEELGRTIKTMFSKGKKTKTTIETKHGLFLQLSCSPVIMPPDYKLGTIIVVSDVSPFIKLDNLRKQFVSTVSHELRTPITAINLSIQNIQKYGDKISKEQEKSIINMIAESSQILTQMIEDLLIASRIEAGRISLTKKQFMLLDVVKNVIDVLKPKITSKSIDMILDIDNDIQIFGDRDRIAQILRILVDNAVKYSPEKSPIRIRARDKYTVVHESNLKTGVLIQVIDKGRGIKKDDLPYLFTKFFRASDVKNIGGTGIGLSIAKELVELHHGNIFVESEYKKGSTFSVFIPAKDYKRKK